MLALVLMATGAMAQSKFGYVSYKELLGALPEYAVVTTHLAELRVQYEAEVARSEREFNQKYVEFIEEQAGFPENIRLKRQRELQELMNHSLLFKAEVQRTMDEAEQDMMRPLREKVDEAIARVCTDGGYDYILNSDDKDTYLFINPRSGKDVTARVKKVLGTD